MTLRTRRVELTNWSKSTHSPCLLYKAHSATDIAKALASARTEGLSVIAHGAGHSYTDAALNTRGLVIDVTPMCRILAWDAARGIMRVEPGVTLRDMVQVAWKDGWWPFVAPSTPDVTVGGCTAMNVNGKNAWKEGTFGEHIVSLDVMLASGGVCTLKPERDTQLFHAFVGSMGLLGMITAITLQLRPVAPGSVSIRRRSAATLAELFALFAEEEQKSDFMEGWIDGFAGGKQLGRGILTCATLDNLGLTATAVSSPAPSTSERPLSALVKNVARLGRPMQFPAVQILNRAVYWLDRWNNKRQGHSALFPYTFWPSAALTSYEAMFPEGVETFQAFIPRQCAQETFEHILTYSQQQGCAPLWCVVKQHRRDPFLLSYQVDGFSLELNYQRSLQSVKRLKRLLQDLITVVIKAHGRFYLAKDGLLTQVQYRQSVGDEVVDAFLQLKQRYDPEMLLQSDLFRRLFQPSLRTGEDAHRLAILDERKERYAISGFPVETICTTPS